MDVLLPGLKNELKDKGVLLALDLYLQWTRLEYAQNTIAAPPNIASSLIIHKDG